MKQMVIIVLATLAVLAAAGCGGSGSGSGSPAAASAPFDQAFVDAMVPHHEQAIEMAKDAKAAGLSQPVLVEIADAIIATQQGEIDRMKDWRGDWFGSSVVDPEGAEGLGLSMNEMGMSSGRMDFASVENVDGAFASMMIAHHEGAIAMARLAQERSDRREIKALADAIVAAQQDEIDLMSEFAADGGHDMSNMGG